MEHFIVVFLLLGAVFAAEKQINLEDIERDNLNSERQVQAQRAYNPTPPPGQQVFVTPRPELSVGPHLFSPEAREYPIFQFFQQPANQQPQQQQQQLYSPRISVVPGHSGFTPIQTAQRQPQQQQPNFAQYAPTLQPQRGAPSSQLYFQDVGFQPSRYAVLQTPTDQSLSTVRAQYPYVDPNTEILKSPNLQQRLSDDKQSHNFAGLIQRYAHTRFLQPNYQSPVPQAYALRSLGSQPIISQPVYVQPQPTATNLNPTYQRANQALGQQRYLVPGINYSGNRNLPLYLPQGPLYNAAPTIQLPQQAQASPSTPSVAYQQSSPLVGVYVPSALQLQYLKQLQQNNIQRQAQPPSSPAQAPTFNLDVYAKAAPGKPSTTSFSPISNLQNPFPIYSSIK